MTFSDIICQEQETESCRVHSLAHDYFKDTEAQNKRDEESRIDLTEPSMWIQMIMKDETCQRCGGLLNWAYILNDRVLCRKCMNEEQGNWDIVSGEFLDSKMDLRIKSIKAKSALKSFYSWLLGLIGVKKKHSKEPIYAFFNISALMFLGEEDVYSEFEDFLQHDDAAIRALAANTIAETRLENYNHLLLKNLEDTNLDVRVRSADAILRIVGP